VPATGVRADVLLTTAQGTRLDEVAPALLARVLPPGQAGALSVDGRPLPPHATVGVPPLVRGALLEVDRCPRDRVRPGPELRCVSGPDAGGRWPLAADDDVVVGRGAAAHVQVDDPLLSRAHCRVRLGAGEGDGADVTDLGATNGTSVGPIADAIAVGAAPIALPVGAAVRAGASTFVLAHGAAAPAPTRATGGGGLAYNRPPRLRAPHPLVEVAFPPPPADRERAPLPVLAVLAPLLLGVVMWRVLGNAAFLLFTLLSPVLVVGAVLTERRSGRRRTRRERLAWQRARAEADAQLAAAVLADEQLRRTTWPDPATTVLTAQGPGGRLWERRPGDDDVLTLAVGHGDLPAQVRTRGDVAAGATTARDVPVVVSLPHLGVAGLAGELPRARALARWVVVQAAVWHSPRDVQVVVLADATAAVEWEWVRWLPHVRAGAGQDCRALLGLGADQAAARVRELLDLIAARRAQSRQPGERHVLVVVDGARALREVPGLARVLADGPAVGVLAVAVEREPQLLPEECRATAVVDAAARIDVHAAGEPVVVGAVVDGISLALAEQVARALAPLCDETRDLGAPEHLPSSARWTQLVGLPLDGGAGDADRVVERWSGCPRSTTALLGAGASGAFSVDLRTDGPHALVAGATGSGKSELLQTLLASLALANRPDELHVVLVDYKGGAAFGPCARLPHVVGLVTDLDDGLAPRALASLRAELRRRERLLAEAGAKDVDALRRLTGPACALPRLLLVVDEFGSLAEDLPDFMTGLVGIAMRGRSLGVHLVLATQRPGGVVSADIRANTNLRLCLAVTRDVDSTDVLDSPLAARIPRAQPGRGYVRTGHGDLAPLQVARVGGRRHVRSPTSPQPVVTVLPAGDLGEPLVGQVEQRDDATDLSLLVDACAQAAERLRLPAARSPWLPPLSAVVALQDLPPHDGARARTLGGVPPVPYALLDLPDVQARATLALDLDSATHLLVVGAARSGRTTALRTLAGSVAATTSAADVHLYAVDATGTGLAPLAALPHTGAVVGRGESDRLERLLGWLSAQLGSRQSTLAACGAASVAEQRASATPDAALPHLLLLLDGWEAFLADHQDRDGGRLVELVHGLLREGPAAGLHVVLTADRTGLSGRLASLVDTRLVLRLADRGDYALAGLPGRGIAPDLPPGRGWLVGAQTAAAQVALLTSDPAGPAQLAALAQLAAASPGVPVGRGPRPFAPLPSRVRLAELRGPAGTSGAVLLGVGGDAPDAVAVELGEACPGLLVAGPPRSGRSTALLTVAAGLRARGLRLVPVAPRPSPLRELPGCLTGLAAPAELEARLQHGGCAVLVDDAELLVDAPLGPALEAAVRHARDTGTVVAAAGTTDELLTRFRGFVVDLRRYRTGVLLDPQGPGDGDLLSVRLPRSAPAVVPPGRGLLCVRGRAQAVQVALP
jgi:S-DNA-T family DNA segregation ATPase FtsK/SpoIIIE